MKSWRLLLGGYFLLLLAYAIFSYSLTDPNLTMLNQTWFYQFQQSMWQWGGDRQLLTATYGVLIGLSFIYYSLLVLKLRRLQMSVKDLIKKYGWLRLMGLYFLVISPLVIAYNGLSHDIFNYIFNAKMVMVYGANPHVQVALDFAQDNWTRFMHNTHTPAPYAYGFTILSLLPYILGLGKFLITWLMFKIMSLVSIGLLIYAWVKYADVAQIRMRLDKLAAVLLNPLFLIEILGNGHNDLWMMAPAILSLAFIAKGEAETRWSWWGWLLMIASIATKYATLVLLPLGLIISMANSIDQSIRQRLPQLGLLFYNKINLKTWILRTMPLTASILMFLPLLLPRAQQFHPWYLVWVLVWIPLIYSGDNSLLQNKIDGCLSSLTFINTIKKFKNWWLITLLIFSITSLYRYTPWLFHNDFFSEVLTRQKIITWSAVLLSTAIFILNLKPKKSGWRRLS